MCLIISMHAVQFVTCIVIFDATDCSKTFNGGGLIKFEIDTFSFSLLEITFERYFKYFSRAKDM